MGLTGGLVGAAAGYGEVKWRGEASITLKLWDKLPAKVADTVTDIYFPYVAAGVWGGVGYLLGP